MLNRVNTLGSQEQYCRYNGALLKTDWSIAQGSLERYFRQTEALFFGAWKITVAGIDDILKTLIDNNYRRVTLYLFRARTSNGNTKSK